VNQYRARHACDLCHCEERFARRSNLICA